MGRMRAYTPFVVIVIFSILIPCGVFAQSEVEERRAALAQQLDAIEAQIQAQQKVLEDRQKQSVTLERDVDILNAQLNFQERALRRYLQVA